ncbi:MAG: PHP domain-containing protein [Desulfobacterales bacterium]|nr:PHP domain-containing protein [Desulfobacterales bacterium]
MTPAAILDHAQKLNLAAIAITDHDSIDGSKEALRTGIPPSLHFLTGVEISAAYPPFFPGSGSFHILGYGIRLEDPAVNQTLKKLQEVRKDRNPKIVRRLNELGYPISLEEVQQTGGKGQIGRPHIALTLKQKGYVASIGEAFRKLLGAQKPAYVEKERLGCKETIEMIRGAGGIAALAHPGLLDIADENQLAALIQNLMNIGMGAIEVYYPQHTAEQTEQFMRLAKQYGLLMTGGTDFHGELTPEIRMGSGNGNLFVPHHIYEALMGAIS